MNKPACETYTTVCTVCPTNCRLEEPVSLPEKHLIATESGVFKIDLHYNRPLIAVSLKKIAKKVKTE